MKLIVLAKKNIASKNICNLLLKNYPNLQNNIFEINADVLELDKFESEFSKLNPELIIVASSHKSESGTPMLSAHFTGNWTLNDLGGEKEKLSIAPALYLREAVLKLYEQQQKLNLSEYLVGMEVTHHSPTFNFPVIFIEVGSTEENWQDKTACLGAAETINHIMINKPEKTDIAIGIGGGHYAQTFNRKIFQKKKIAFGHIIPKYQIEKVKEKLILEAFKKTIPKPDFAVIDWKGCGKSKYREQIINVLNKNNIRWIKDKEL